MVVREKDLGRDGGIHEQGYSATTKGPSYRSLQMGISSCWMGTTTDSLLSAGEASAGAGIQAWALYFRKNVGEFAQVQRRMGKVISPESCGLFKLQ